MMKWMIFSLLASFSLFADDAAMPPTKKQKVETLPHVWLSGDMLLLKAQENRLSFANAESAGGPFTNSSLVAPHFEWNSGVRVNAGFQLTKWMCIAEWMFIENKAHGEKYTDGSTGFFPILSLDPSLTAANFVTSGKEDWRLVYNVFDLGGAYPWKWASWLIVKLHAALRTAFFDQTATVYYSGGVFDEGMDKLTLKNDFFGMGPDFGFTPCISLGYGFSLLGDLSSSILGGRFFLKQRERYLNTTLYSHSGFLPHITWTLDAKAALGWQTEILYKALVISAQVGWEWHKLYNQNRLPQNQFEFFNGNRGLIMRGGYASLALGF